MSIESIVSRRAEYTPEYIYIRGEYRIGGQQLPYYATAMSAKDASDNISMPFEVVLAKELKIEEIFQRELDEDRVQDEIVPYLKQRARVKFFNALTVALLPMEREGKLAEGFPEEDPDAPHVEIDETVQQKIEVGTVRLVCSKVDNSIGRIAWNKRRVRPIVVDGQHRLFALKKLFADSSYSYRTELENTQLPVLLLVLDPRAGFKSEGGTLLTTVRSVFVDLNKHAKPVPKARNYLLDDRDLPAVCMRNVLEEGVDKAPAGDLTRERVRNSGRLPLVLVDWYTEKAKFDTGLHLTSVHALYDIVTDCLALPKFDPTEYDKIDTFINYLCARLDVDKLKSRLIAKKAQAEEEQLPFWLPTELIAEAGSAFGKRWAPMISHLLTNVTSYSKLIEISEGLDLIGGPYELWGALDVPGKRKLENEGEIPVEAIRKRIQEEKAGDYAYQVVFQKAIASAMFAMERQRTEQVDWESELEDVSPREFGEKWVMEFNRRLASLLVERPRLEDGMEFWVGAGVKLDGNILWTKSAQKAITGLVVTTMCAPVDKWEDELNGLAKSKEWLKGAWEKIKRGKKADNLSTVLSVNGKHWRMELEKTALLVEQNRTGKRPSSEEAESKALDYGALRLIEVAKRIKSGPGIRKPPEFR